MQKIKIVLLAAIVAVLLNNNVVLSKNEDEQSKAVSKKPETKTLYVEPAAMITEIKDIEIKNYTIEKPTTQLTPETEDIPEDRVVPSSINDPELIIPEDVQQIQKVQKAKKEKVPESVQKEIKTQEETKNKSKYDFTEDEIYMFASLIFLEAGACSYECQLAVGSVVLNLMKKENRSLKSCIYAKGHFSVAKSISRKKVSDTSLKAARYLAENGPTIKATSFRTKHYHTWATPYCKIDNVYFSY